MFAGIRLLASALKTLTNAYGLNAGFRRATEIYNPPMAITASQKHPKSMGESYDTTWWEVADFVVPLMRKALSGQSHYSERQGIFVDRKSYLEETYFTWTMSPILDDNMQVAGWVGQFLQMQRRRKLLVRHCYLHPDHNLTRSSLPGSYTE